MSEIQVETKFEILTAQLSHDPIFPGIWVTLRVPSGETITLAAVEVDRNDEEDGELRTIVYRNEKYEDPTEYLIHILMTQKERDEVYASQRVPE